MTFFAFYTTKVTETKIFLLNHCIERMEKWIAEIHVGEAAQNIKKLFQLAGATRVGRFAQHYCVDLTNFQ